MVSFRHLLLVSVACATGACGTEPGVLEVATTTTEAGVATTVAAAAGTTESTTPATYRLPDGLPEGSGCSPNLSDGLPSGIWFGYLHSVGISTLTFDLACFYSGSQADVAATTDGTTATGGVYVRNPTVDLLELEVNEGISIQNFDENGERIDSGDWYPQWYLSAEIPEAGRPVWIVQQPTRISALVDLG